MPCTTASAAKWRACDWRLLQVGSKVSKGNGSNSNVVQAAAQPPQKICYGKSCLKNGALLHVAPALVFGLRATSCDAKHCETLQIAYIPNCCLFFKSTCVWKFSCRHKKPLVQLRLQHSRKSLGPCSDKHVDDAESPIYCQSDLNSSFT